MKKQLLSVFSLILSLSFASFALEKNYEFIVAEVGEEVITYSEVVEAMEQLSKVPGYAGLPHDQLQKKVLDRMIDDKVILNRAKKDSLEISDAEVNSRIDRHIASIASRQGVDVATINKAIEQQTGASIEEYRATLFKQIKDQGTLQQVQMRYVGQIKPTRKEVEDFYKEYQDSLPKLKNAYHIAHIQRKVRASVAMVDSVYKVAKSVVEKLDKGSKFEDMVKEYSQDKTAGENGDIGFFKQGSLEKSYENVAFRLELGKYYDFPVKTSKGYHIIKKLAERDSEVRTAHILFRIQPTSQDTANVKSFLDSIKTETLKNSQPKDKFMELAVKFSDDDEVKINRGDLGWFQYKDLEQDYASAVNDLSTGSITEVIQIGEDYHIFYLLEKAEERSLSLEDNFTEIENMAVGIFSNRKLDTFVKQWRESVYIKIRWQPGQEK